MKTRRAFLEGLVLSATTALVAPLAFGSSADGCGCGSGMDTRIDGRCTECATADEMNRWLFIRGLRPCPHSHHSSDEEFALCRS